MLYVVIIYLWTAILLYLLLGGADFGAGIIELFTSKKNERLTRRTMYKAIGPIWEANHMWLIITIVILFVGFPVIYTTMSVHLHIPLVIMLLGIIARGTAFTFRHYDAVVDDMQTLYNRIFTLSSFTTPLFLGIIAGSAVSGRIDTGATDFLSAYIFSWFNFFSFAVGFFTVTICGFLAAIYLVGETDHIQFKRHFIKKAYHMSFAALGCGTLVFMAAIGEGIPLGHWIFGNAVGLTSITAALVSLVLLWYLLRIEKTKLIRLLAGFQVTMILVAITYIHYPNIVILKNGNYLSLIQHSGHVKTIDSLAWALILGSLFILPALFYLIYSFQKKSTGKEQMIGK
jgi:cytochrome bd ubiquinol oxidase subunit II